MHTSAVDRPRLRGGTPPPESSYDIDIIVLALDRFDETIKAVISALDQTGPSFHVHILDQGSAPETQARFTLAFRGVSNISYYVTDKNLGVPGGRNFLSEVGKGRIIIALDNDAVFADRNVAAQVVAAFDRDRSLGAVAFNILAADGVQPDRSSWGYPARMMDRYNDEFDVVTFVGAGHAIRRRAWIAAGGYDSSLFFTWEELDFCLRAIALGWVIRYDGSLRVIHKPSARARQSWSNGRTRLFVRNRLTIARKWRASWIALTPRILGYLIRGILDRRLSPTLFGIIEAFRHDPLQPKTTMKPAMKDYILRNDLRYRGSLWTRARTEIFRRPRFDPY